MRMERVKAYKRKSTVVSEKISELEVLTVVSEEHLAVVNHFKVHEGAIIQTHAWEVRRQHEEEDTELLSAALEHLVDEEEELAPEIAVNLKVPDHGLEDTRVFVPSAGRQKAPGRTLSQKLSGLTHRETIQPEFQEAQIPGGSHGGGSSSRTQLGRSTQAH